MEADSLVALGQLEERADLVGGPSLDVAEHDHALLQRRQRVDRGVDVIERLAPGEVLLG